MFSHFIGATAVFKMKSKNYIRIYSMYHHQPMVSSKDVITNGNYDGTFAPNSLIYLTFTSYSVFNDNNYLSVVGNKDDTPISNLVTIKLPTNMLSISSNAANDLPRVSLSDLPHQGGQRPAERLHSRYRHRSIDRKCLLFN